MIQALTSAELASLRADLAVALPDRCGVERDASQDAPPDGYGHAPPPVWVPHLVDQPCSYWQASGATTADDREVVIYRHVLALPHGTDVRPTDRIVDVIDAEGRPRNLEPLRVDAVVPYPTHLELALVEVTW